MPTFLHYFKQGLFLKRILLLLLVCVSSVTFSQSSINTLRIEFKLDDASTAVNPSTIPDVVFNIEAGDLTGVKKVIITLGSAIGGSEFFTYTLNVDGSSLPTGVTLNIQGNKIEINTGSHSGVIQFYASAKLEYQDGTQSAVKMVSNVQ